MDHAIRSKEHRYEAYCRNGKPSTRTAKEARGPCPICGGSEAATKFRITPDGIFHCFEDQSSRHDAEVAKILDQWAGKEWKPAPQTVKRETVKAQPKPVGERQHKYYDADGVVHCIKVIKTDSRGCKTGQPFWRHKAVDGSMKLGRGGIPASSLLYGREQAGDWQQIETVILCEGEKDADTGNKLLRDRQQTGAVFLSVPNGAGAKGDLDWAYLREQATELKTLYVFFDADAAGRKGVQAFGRRAVAELPKTKVLVFADQDGDRKGYDLSDADSEGKAVEWLTRHKDQAKRPEPEPEPEPVDDGREIVPGLKDEYMILECLNRMGYELRFNVRTVKFEMREVGSDGSWETMDGDAEFECLRMDLMRQFHYQGEDKKIRRVIYSSTDLLSMTKALQKRVRVDPFLDYVNGLPAWDKVERLPTLLQDIFGLVPGEDNERLGEWGGLNLFLGSLTRVLEPGEKSDTLPCLLGEQGLRKSTLFGLMFPADLRDACFTDSVDLALPAKELSEITAGSVICEVPDLQGVRGSRLNKLKAYLSRTSDRGRAAWAKYVKDTKREFLFWGTANKRAGEEICEVIPYDPTGSRRFPVIDLSCKPGEDRTESYMKENRDQCWAEALVRYHNGERAYLTTELEVLVNRQASKYHGHNAYSDIIVECLEEDGVWVSGETLLYLMVQCDCADVIRGDRDTPDRYRLPGNSRIRKEFTDALIRVGYNSRRETTGKKQVLWFYEGEKAGSEDVEDSNVLQGNTQKTSDLQSGDFVDGETQKAGENDLNLPKDQETQKADVQCKKADVQEPQKNERTSGGHQVLEEIDPYGSSGSGTLQNNPLDPINGVLQKADVLMSKKADVQPENDLDLPKNQETQKADVQPENDTGGDLFQVDERNAETYDNTFYSDWPTSEEMEAQYRAENSDDSFDFRNDYESPGWAENDDYE